MLWTYILTSERLHQNTEIIHSLLDIPKNWTKRSRKPIICTVLQNKNKTASLKLYWLVFPSPHIWNTPSNLFISTAECNLSLRRCTQVFHWILILLSVIVESSFFTVSSSILIMVYVLHFWWSRWSRDPVASKKKISKMTQTTNNAYRSLGARFIEEYWSTIENLFLFSQKHSLYRMQWENEHENAQRQSQWLWIFTLNNVNGHKHIILFIIKIDYSTLEAVTWTIAYTITLYMFKQTDNIVCNVICLHKAISSRIPIKSD